MTGCTNYGRGAVNGNRVTEVADRYIADNNFPPELVSQIRTAEYSSTSVEEFWKKLEDLEQNNA